jgi:adenine/guanine phosphoribosyltransferase-like PRPP-binding protein
MQHVSIFVVLYIFFTTFSLTNTIACLKKKYNDNDFVINYWFGKFCIFHSKDYIKPILLSDSKLPFFNHNFNHCHNHMKTINCVDVGSKLWIDLHNGLKHIITNNKQYLEYLLELHSNIIKNNTTTININCTLEDFIIKVWIDYTFGLNSISKEHYLFLRNKIIKLLKKTFYNNLFIKIPILGYYSSKIGYWINHTEFEEIDNEIKTLLTNNINTCKQNKGIMIELYHYFLAKSYSEYDALIITCDNSFLSFLVYDFIYNIVLDAVLHIDNNQYSNEKKTIIDKATHDSFLFPYRARRINTSVQISENCVLTKNDFVLMHLRQPSLYFSYGPRACVGYTIFNNVIDYVYDVLKKRNLQVHNQYNIIYSKHQDLNMIISQHNGTLEPYYPRSYLTTHLPSYKHNDIDKYYDVLDICRQPDLYNFITKEIVKIIVANGINCIVAPEARAWPFASAAAVLTNIQFISIRKKGKLPGPIYSTEYVNNDNSEKKTACSSTTLEISSNIPNFVDKKIMIIDDGMASCGTILSCIDLVKQYGIQDENVKRVVCIINHTYIEKLEQYTKYLDKTTSFFDL